MKKERYFISSGKRTSRSCTDTSAIRPRRLKQQFGRFRGRDSGATHLRLIYSPSVCRTDVHRDRERLL